MFGEQVKHIAAFDNRVPVTVLAWEVFGALVALTLLTAYVAPLGRQVFPVLLGAALVAGLLFVTFDLDRPTRGVTNVEPTALIAQQSAMVLPGR